jgi:hypothetical protein
MQTLSHRPAKKFLRYRLWTREQWYLFREEGKRAGGLPKIVLDGSGDHNLGVVPVFPLDCSGQGRSPY